MKGISLFQEGLDFHRFSHPFQQIDPDAKVDLCGGRSPFLLTVPHLSDDISGKKQSNHFTVFVKDRTAAGAACGWEIMPDQQIPVLAGIFHFKVADGNNDAALHGSDWIVDIDISFR